MSLNDNRIQNLLEKLSSGMSRNALKRAAQKSGIVEYARIHDICTEKQETFVNLRVKPVESDKYVVCDANGNYSLKRHSETSETDNFVIRVVFESYLVVREGIYGERQQRISVARSKPAFVAITPDGAIVKRFDKATGEYVPYSWESLKELTPEELSILFLDFAGKMTTRAINGNPALMQRSESHNGKVSIFGKYQEQQRAKRKAKTA